jgi:RHS repeat-associated protein
VSEVAQALERGVEQDLLPAAKDAATAVENAVRSVAEGATGVAERTEATEADLVGKFGQVGTKDAETAISSGEAEAARAGAGAASGAEGDLREATGAGQAAEGNAACETGGDPVDVISGQMITSTTDVNLPGLLPLVLRRAYASGYVGGRMFGPGWSSTLDQRVSIDADGIHFAGDDAQVLHYPVPSRPGKAVLPADGARWPLTWDRASDTIRIEDPRTGWTRHFTTLGATETRGRSTRPITAMSDRNGHRITYVCDEEGIPTEVQHSGGYRIAVDTAYTAAGFRVEALRLLHPGNGSHGTVLVTYRYDPRGRLAAIADSTGRPYVYEYDDANRMCAWIDRTGFRYAYGYDDAGRVALATGDDGYLSATFEYDVEARVTTVTNSLGHPTRYHYDEQNHVTGTVDPLGNETLTETDRYGRLVKRVDALGRVLTSAYDPAGNLVRVTRPDGEAVTAEYNALCLPVAITDAAGATRRYTYDESGNRLSVTGATGTTVEQVYDSRGNLVRVHDAADQELRFSYNPAGLVTEAIDHGGNATLAGYDAFGRVARVVDPLGGAVELGWTPEGRAAHQVARDGSRQSWAYDGEGNLLEHADAAGRITRFEYAPFNKLAARVDPDGSRYEIRYDTELQLAAVTNPQGLTWDYTYDAAGRLTRESDFNDRTVAYEYDACGQLIRRTNGAGQTVEFVRDLLGNVSEQRAEGAVTRFAYDVRGDLISAAEQDGPALEFTRDAVGRILSETYAGQSVLHEYDRLGRRVGRTTPSGQSSRWEFAPNGLPVSLVTGTGSLTFEHDALGREATRFLGPSAALTHNYDEAGRLTGQGIWTYLTDGELPTEPGTPEASPTYRSLSSRQYTYGADGRVTRVDDQHSGTRTFTLDDLGRVTAVHGAQGEERFGYDGAGNLTMASATAASGGTRDDSDVEASTRTFSGTLLRDSGRDVYEYDGQGRLVRRIRKTLSGKRTEWAFGWDALDRLVSVATPDGASWRYAYDPLGRRVAKYRESADGEVLEEIRFAWDGTRLAEETHLQPGHPVTTTTWEHRPGSWTPIAQTRRSWLADSPQEVIDERFHAIVTDLAGTPTDLVTPDGRIAWRSASGFWGGPGPVGTDEAAAEDGSTEFRLRFPGQYHDPETGLHYNYMRYYEPETARYLSPDPLGLAAAPNNYAYVGDPRQQADPLGLTPVDTPSPVKIITVYRYGDRTNPYELTPKLASAPADVQAQVAGNMADPAWAAQRAEDHMAGDTLNTPFISVAGDYHAAAATTDPWLHDITRKAPDLATFRVPEDRLVMPHNPLSISETEMLFNGNDLKDYLVKWDKNPYLGKP